MTKTAWVVDWEDLSMICATKEAAIDYVNKEAKKFNASIRWHNFKYTDWVTFACAWKDEFTGNEFIEVYDIREYPIQM